MSNGEEVVTETVEQQEDVFSCSESPLSIVTSPTAASIKEESFRGPPKIISVSRVLAEKEKIGNEVPKFETGNSDMSSEEIPKGSRQIFG